MNLCLISLLSIGAIATSGSPNLVPDPKFKSQWSQFDIVRPCQVKLSDGKAHLSGGTVFLHSRLFDAPPAVQLMVEATVQGQGTAAVEILWWDRSGLPAKPHRSSSKKRSTDRSSKISFLIRSPQTAVKAQVRLVVQGGEVTFSNPKLGVIEGQLLLHLDGAAPGPKPKQQWVDRTNINHPLSVGKNVNYIASQRCYRFSGKGSTITGAAKDAARFQFPTDISQGAGRGTPFTIVVLAKLAPGRSSTLLGKTDSKTGRGWFVMLSVDEFQRDYITTFQQHDGRSNRTILRFPDPNKKLGVRDQKYHLYVIHISGTGRSLGCQVFLDGKKTPVGVSPWSFGTLTKSIQNNGPLRIGAQAACFRGDLRLLEIWRGSRLKHGMTPANYSAYRYAQIKK